MTLQQHALFAILTANLNANVPSAEDARNALTATEGVFLMAAKSQYTPIPLPTQEKPQTRWVHLRSPEGRRVWLSVAPEPLALLLAAGWQEVRG